MVNSPTQRHYHVRKFDCSTRYATDMPPCPKPTPVTMRAASVVPEDGEKERVAFG